MWRCAIRLVIALVLGLTLHAAWMALFILGASLGASGIVRGALWLVGPIMTAAGYATGLTIRVQGVSTLKWRFWQVFIVVLVCCAVGAIVGRPLGPMFVGLGVLAAGGLSSLALVIWTARKCTEISTDGSVAAEPQTLDV
jgi:hypothetical protein